MLGELPLNRNPPSLNMQEVLKEVGHVLDEARSSSNIELAVLSAAPEAGYLHGFSDIDVYVIGDGLENSFENIRVGGLEIQLNWFTNATLDKFTALYGATASSVGYSHSQLDEHRKVGKAASRFIEGSVLWGSEEILGVFASISETRFVECSVAAATQGAMRNLEDALGGEMVQDWLITQRALETAYSYALDAVLLAAGNIHFGAASLYRRIAVTFGEGGVSRRLIECSSFAGFVRQRADLTRWQLGRAYANMISALTSLANLREPSEHLEVDLLEAAIAGHTSEVNPFFVVQRRGAELGISGPGRGLRVNSAVATHWFRALSGYPISSRVRSAFDQRDLLAAQGGIP